MTLLTVMLLIASFLGVNLGGDTLESPEPCTAGLTPGFEDVATGNYADDWYAWEWCLFDGSWPAEGDFSRHGTPQQSLQVAQYFVNELWRRYTPWMEQALEAGAPLANVSAKGRVSPPTVHMGPIAVAKYCPAGSFGCGGGASVRWRGTRLDYTPGVIVVHDINIFPLLHELAHAIDRHQWYNNNNGDVEARENNRTNGHGLSFKCLALDLYQITGSVSVPIYNTLNGLCHRYASDYAQSDG